MLDRRRRALIEWHFYNYEVDTSLAKEKEKDITYANLTANMTPSIGRGNKTSDPTAWKAEKLFELGKDWGAVVRNTFTAFKFEPEYEIMVLLYVRKMRYNEIIKSDKNKYGLNESTFWFWRNRWLETACMWAEEFKLV